MLYTELHILNSSRTLNVRLNDAVTFNCSVEAPEDRIENIVLVAQEEHLVECDIGPTGESNNLARNLGSCENTGDDHFLAIIDALELNNRPRFVAGEAYYITSKYCN